MYNNSGIATSLDAWLGRGILYVGEILAASGGVNFWRDVGNATAFALTPDSSEVTHKLSYNAIRTIDDRVSLEQSYGVSFTLDAMNFNNLAWWLSGPSEAAKSGLLYTYTNPVNGTGSITNASFALGSQVVLGRWFNLVDTTGARVYDIQLVTDVSVTTQTTGTALVLNRDYILDLTQGRIFLLDSFDGTLLLEAIAEGLKATIAKSASAAATLDQIEILQGTVQAVSLLFKAINPRNANQTAEIFLPRVKVGPTSDLNLIGEDWATMDFEGQLLQATATGTMQADVAGAPYGWIRGYTGAVPGVSV